MKVFLDSVGCKLNQSEIEKYAGQFRSAGHILVSTQDEADVVIINTCAVTSAAAQDSRQKIRRANQSLTQKRIIATGCLASLDEAMEHLGIPNLEIVNNLVKDSLVEDLFGIHPSLGYFDRQPIPGERSRKRAFIKVQDGCDNFCTFCVTRLARGKGRSIAVNEVLKDIQGSVQNGSMEVILTGVHLGSWGSDFTERKHLRDLIESILSVLPENIRLRVSSLEPWDIHHDFFSLWQDERLCRHFHLPLQSGSEQILKRMARQTTTEGYRSLIDSLLDQIPDAAITTDLIVGFPGETDEDHRNSLSFISRLPFAGGHVFTFSSREGTAAARYTGQINGKVKQQRSREARQLFETHSEHYRKSQVGTIQTVLWEDHQPLQGGGFLVSGWTGNYIRVSAPTEKVNLNSIDRVIIDKLSPEGCLANIIQPGTPSRH